jgi:hypothetical protein
VYGLLERCGLRAGRDAILGVVEVGDPRECAVGCPKPATEWSGQSRMRSGAVCPNACGGGWTRWTLRRGRQEAVPTMVFEKLT